MGMMVGRTTSNNQLLEACANMGERDMRDALAARYRHVGEEASVANMGLSLPFNPEFA
jgi:hypothetical protein